MTLLEMLSVPASHSDETKTAPYLHWSAPETINETHRASAESKSREVRPHRFAARNGPYDSKIQNKDQQVVFSTIEPIRLKINLWLA